MRQTKLISLLAILVIASLLVAACGTAQPAAAPTVAPTAAPTPTEAMAKFTLECDIDTDHYGWYIDGEKGAYTSKSNDVTQSREYDPDGNLTFITIEVDETRTYKESGNSYVFVGEISLNVKDDTVAYHITATGETLPEPQTCQP